MGFRKIEIVRQVVPGQTRMSAPAVVVVVLLSVLVSGAARAADQIPGKPQEGPILLSGGDVFTVSGEVIRGGHVLIDGGKVVAVGKDVELPSGAKRIDLAGKRVYPGLFASGNDLGLAEVRSVRGMMDTSEAGDINPNARAEVAVNPDSELIPVARANGVLLNLTMPGGGMLSGTGAVLQLDGWTWEEMTVCGGAAMHVAWPRTARAGRRGGGGGGGEEGGDPGQRRNDQVRALEQAFADARAYLQAKRATTRPSGAGGVARTPDHDARWEAMIPLLEGRVPLVVTAEELGQIQAAVAFAAREKVRLVIFGGYDAPLCADLLKAHDVAVIVNGIHRLPLRPDAPYDEPFTVPERLRKAGVRYCITLAHRFGGSDVRNLPYHAATAAAYGLPPDEALKAITLYPAQILGVADRVGALAAGRDATLIVTDGDILETATHVELAFVQGRQVDLTSKHTGLWQKYQEKYRRQASTRTAAGVDPSPAPQR
jgi:imidazolonepropionase-like amidohydrolase